MCKTSAFPKSLVTHRIGGLEINSIDDLERYGVTHRIGGLEIYAQNSSLLH